MRGLVNVVARESAAYDLKLSIAGFEADYDTSAGGSSRLHLRVGFFCMGYV